MARKAIKTGDGPPNSLADWLLKNQTGFSFNLIAFLFLTHLCVPGARHFTSKFFLLSYYNPASGKYASGHDDAYFIAFCILLFTGIRASLMQYVLGPLARHWGVSKKKDVTRFAEQGWMLMYNSVFWTTGIYIYYTSPHFLNMEQLWTDWPQRELDGLVKGYILAQWSYWTQQLLVVNMETRRKDYWQMIAHHFATIILIASGYVYHQSRVSNLILVLMDAIELIFPLAKCLKCLGYNTLCDVVFGVFIVTWFITRHVLYLKTCWSLYFDTPRLMPTSCYKGTADNLEGPLPVPEGWSYLLEPFRNPAGIVCMDDGIKIGFLSFLLILQVIMVMWSYFIVLVVIRVLKGDGAEDVRSDEEEEEEQLEDIKHEIPQALEEEVGVDAIDFEVWKRRAGVKEATRTSGLSLAGHSDRKELLNRIGCEKQID
ncbi:longevity assurance proteins LAG1/LAC1 [Hypoxylon trugodes]|uniref:longevity assurance proteins LAG1/LAC1 n=1 Tax=Hypoxylon trugodes TaxID=326681 RepID=UPI0021903347|nr:longevity assurance proteins LAG1/LAC1 [Hypoxylon trugodes]KAI1382667.1 longevity assurance proteins LAG1/LAC1 [Hypoxylon trugodes]